jgi:hypothetical protein
MIDYDACLDELVKIAEDDRWATKEKLKRLGTTVLPAAAIGTGLGMAAGRMLHRQVYPGSLAVRAGKKIPRGLMMKYGPGVLAGVGAAAAAARYNQRRKVRQALEGDKK